MRIKVRWWLAALALSLAMWAGIVISVRSIA
jgi:hypothetical protein